MATTKEIAEEAAKEAVRATFDLLGVNVADPQSVEEFRNDLRFSRSIRKRGEQGVDAIWKLVFLAIAGSLITAVANQLGLGKHV